MTTSCHSIGQTLSESRGKTSIAAIERSDLRLSSVASILLNESVCLACITDVEPSGRTTLSSFSSAASLSSFDYIKLLHNHYSDESAYIQYMDELVLH